MGANTAKVLRERSPVDGLRGDLVLPLRLLDVDDGSLPAPVEGHVGSSFGLASQDARVALVRGRLGDGWRGVDLGLV